MDYEMKALKSALDDMYIGTNCVASVEYLGQQVAEAMHRYVDKIVDLLNDEELDLNRREALTLIAAIREDTAQLTAYWDRLRDLHGKVTAL